MFPGGTSQWDSAALLKNQRAMSEIVSVNLGVLGDLFYAICGHSEINRHSLVYHHLG